MRGRLPRWGVLTITLIGVATLMGLLAWPRLPARMAIHFSVTGRAGNYVPTHVGIFVLPVGMTLTALTIIAATRMDPPDDPRSLAVTLVGTMLLFSALQAFLLGWNLGYRLPFALVIVTILGWALLILGYVLVRETGAG